MPNTCAHRLESSCMPPKKSAWRFESGQLAEHSSSKSENSYNMGLLSDDSGVKPVQQMHFYPPMEALSHMKHAQPEDAPIDFSLKKCDSTDKTESINHLTKRKENYEHHNGGSNMINPPQMQMFHPTVMFNGNHSPSSLQNNNSPDSQASSSFKDSDSIDMDCSQESVKSPHLVTPYRNRSNEMVRENSPHHRSVSRENSPVNGQASILEEMLKGQQQSNFGIPTSAQTFGNGFAAGMGVYENQIIASPSPPIAMSTPVMHPASMLPLAMGPYFPYAGYTDQPNPFMPGYMYKTPEQNMVDVSAVRKSKRKMDPFTESLKSCSVEELRKKLDSLSRGSSLGINTDYAINLKPPSSIQRDNDRRFSNITSLENVKNEPICSTARKEENGEADTTVTSHNQMNTKNNGVINHNNENNTLASDGKPTENINPNAENPMANVANGTVNISGADDTNDSQPSTIPESSPNSRKRNPSQDYRDDPNYRMKRAKNNLAARRSRESRRIKEEIIRQTAAVLEQQNKVMARDMQTMRLNYEEIRMKYFSLMKDFESMKIQTSILTERLNQKRCGQCGSALPSVN